MVTAMTKSVVGIILWLNYFITSFSKSFTSSLLKRLEREMPLRLVHSLRSPMLCIVMVTEVRHNDKNFSKYSYSSVDEHERQCG